MFPPLPLPIIAGFLESLGHKTVVLDLNIDFFHYIFSDEFIENFLQLYKKLEVDVSEFEKTGIKTDNIEQKIKVLGYIKDYFQKTAYDIYKTQEYCSEYKKTTSDINLFFDSWKIKIYHYKIIIYCEILLKLQTIYPDIFKSFFNEQIEKILNIEADYIGFSMSDVDQFFYSIQLAKKIKKKKNIKICFGGTCVNYFYDKKIKDKVKFHKQIADFIMFGAGEFPHEDMAKYIDGELDISKVRNIEYMDENNNIHRNKTTISGYIPKYYTKFDDLDFSKYYTPQIVLSVETTKGCYWNKCAFCTRASLHDGFQSRRPEDVADDIEALNKKYNVKYFHLMDDCVPVNFAEKFAQCIIDKKLEVYFMTFMRFEKKMTKQYLQKLYDAGMRLIIWGLESPSQDRLNYINKGLNMEVVKRVLADCKEIGIKSNVTFIVDFPNETKEELQYTIDFIKEYTDLISFVQIHQFTLLENTPMFNNPEKYNISQDFIEKTKQNGGYAKYNDPQYYENILESTSIQGMMRGAPPLCLYTTGGSLLYTMRDKILKETLENVR